MYLISNDSNMNNNIDNNDIDDMNRLSVESGATTLGMYDSLQYNVKKWLSLIKNQL
jgi:hypothetical protein